MSKFFQIIFEITRDVCNEITYFIKNNLLNFAAFLNLVLPYLMYYIGQYVVKERGATTFGGELFIPIIFVVITYYLRSMANKLRKGIKIPLPEKRFTEIDEDGEVSIEHSRLQELILYIADLEDWLERKGLI